MTILKARRHDCFVTLRKLEAHWPIELDFSIRMMDCRQASQRTAFNWIFSGKPIQMYRMSPNEQDVDAIQFSRSEARHACANTVSCRRNRPHEFALSYRVNCMMLMADGWSASPSMYTEIHSEPAPLANQIKVDACNANPVACRACTDMPLSHLQSTAFVAVDSAIQGDGRKLRVQCQANGCVATRRLPIQLQVPKCP